jgi:hypothetical protein
MMGQGHGMMGHGHGMMGQGHGGEGRGRAAGMGDVCPVKIPGAEMAVADVDGGVAISYTTRTGDVAELRRRVQAMAARHQDPATARHDMGHPSRPMHGGMAGTPTANVQVTAEEIEGGARLILRASDPTRLEELRRHVRAHAERMTAESCPMRPAGGTPPPADK